MLAQATTRNSRAKDPVEQQLDALEHRLPRQLAAAAATSEPTVRNWIREERRRYTDAAVRSFIPILIQRAVTERAGLSVSTAAQSLIPAPKESAGPER